MKFILSINTNTPSDEIDGWKDHERRHVLSITLAVKQRVVNPLLTEEAYLFDEPEKCETRRKEVLKKYGKMIEDLLALKNHKKGDGKNVVLEPDVGANEYSPGDGDPEKPITDDELAIWLKLVETTTEIRPIRNIPKQ